MINLKTCRKGDTIIFANGTKGVVTVIYPNGGYFLRWAEYDENGRPQPWSESDSWCCSASFPADGKCGYKQSWENGLYIASPRDIIDIIKPPLEDLQDEISRLNKELECLKPLPSIAFGEE